MMQLVRSLNLESYVEVLPRVGRVEAMRWTAAAQVCVVLPQDSRMALPSKVFELAQLRSWLLVFASPDSATASALNGTGATVVAPTDERGATAALHRAILAFRAGERPPRADSAGLMLRSQQVEKLQAHLDRITATAIR